MTLEKCRETLKRVTARPRVGLTKWYDVVPAQLSNEFGHPVVPSRGSWLACWPEGTDLSLPDQ